MLPARHIYELATAEALTRIGTARFTGFAVGINQALEGSEPPYSARLRSLQALRFIAAALVVYAHAVDSGLATGARPLVAGTTLENFGAIGVDIFFVISGFIITRTAQRAQDAVQFWRDRLLRILPLYWLLSIPAAAIAIGHDGFHPATLLTTLLFWPIWGQFAAPYITVGWTLSFEMLFYLCMGLTRLRLDPRWLLAVFFSLLLANIISPSPLRTFLGNPIMFEFLAGIAIARWGSTRLAWPAFLTAVVWLALTLIAGPGSNAEIGNIVSGELVWQRLLLWGVPSALLVYGATGLENRCSGRVWMVLAKLGDASYAIYLSHRFITLFGGKLVMALGIGHDVTLPMLAVAVLAGWLVHIWIERPIDRSIRALRKPTFREGSRSRIVPAT